MPIVYTRGYWRGYFGRNYAYKGEKIPVVFKRKATLQRELLGN